MTSFTLRNAEGVSTERCVTPVAVGKKGWKGGGRRKRRSRHDREEKEKSIRPNLEGEREPVRILRGGERGEGVKAPMLPAGKKKQGRSLRMSFLFVITGKRNIKPKVPCSGRGGRKGDSRLLPKREGRDTGLGPESQRFGEISAIQQTETL